MDVLKNVFSQKKFWLGLFTMILVVCIFMIGFLGSIVNMKPKDLPVALIVMDNGIKTTSSSLNFGETLSQSLKSNKDIPIKWSVLQTKAEAITLMNDRYYYAAIVIPEETSHNISSILQPDSRIPEIHVIINEGMNYTAANITSDIIDQITSDMTNQIQEVIYQQLEHQSIALPLEKIKLLNKPLIVKKEVINNVDSRTANGNTPILFTQILWLSIFICSLILFIIVKRTTNSPINFATLITQLIAGSLFLLVTVSSILLFANYILDVNIPNMKYTFLFLFFSGLVFFLLQNALINWIGLIASPLILLLFLFSIPILNQPPEFLPNVTNKMLYSWIPLKFTVEGLREIFFFENHNVSKYVATLSYIGIVSLIFMSLSIFKKQITGKMRVR